jgi:peptidoglycan/LPS O-acetylase OafA/YrhL
MAFEFESYDTVYIIAMFILHALAVLSGILAVWYSGDPVVKWCMSRKWFAWITAFSFVIFALHIPLLAYVTRLMFMFAHNIPNYRIITYILAPTTVLFFCIGIAALFRKTLPKIYWFATGGRGF